MSNNPERDEMFNENLQELQKNINERNECTDGLVDR
jgi:hypothetical protein